MERKMSVCCGQDHSLSQNRGQMNTSCNIPQSKCSLAMAYVPWQKWEPLYEEEKALAAGTAFPSLDLPFCGRGII